MKPAIKRILGLTSALLLACLTASAADLRTSYDWKPVKIGGGGWVTGIIMHPTAAGVMYCKTDTNGAYRWNAATSDWTMLVNSTSMPTAEVTVGLASGVDAIAIAPSDPNVFFMSLRGTVYKSTNRGDTFVATNLMGLTGGSNGPYRFHGERMAVDPANASVVYYGTFDEGLMVSTDGGMNYALVSTVPFGTVDEGGCNSIIFDPGSGTTGGKTNRIYVAVWGIGIYKTEDAGATWSIIPGGPINAKNMELAADRKLWIAGDNKIWKLSGTTWTTSQPGGNVDQWELAVDPFDANRVFAVKEGGPIYRTTNGGTSWTTLTRNGNNNGHPWILNQNPNGWLSIGEIRFDPLVQGRMWMAEGIGVHVTDDLADSNITWTFMVEGIEQLVTFGVMKPPGGKLFTTCADMTGFIHNAGPDLPPDKRVITTRFAHGTSLCYQWDNPNFIVGVSARDAVNNENNSGYSTDGGLTWTTFPSVVSDTRTSPYNQLKEGVIRVATGNSDHMVWASAPGSSVFYTTDRGVTWGYAQNQTYGKALTHKLWHMWFKADPLEADSVTPDRFYFHWSQSLSEYFDGLIDDLRIYDGTALSAAQVQSLFSGTLSTPAATNNWRFNGNANDSITGITGAIQGSANVNYTTTKKEGIASLRLTGSLDGVVVNDASFRNSFAKYTVAVWFRPDVVTEKRMLFQEGDAKTGFGMRVNGNVLEARAASNYVTIDASVSGVVINAWQLAVATYDAGVLTVYLNGSAVSQSTPGGPASIASHGGKVGIGVNSGTDVWGDEQLGEFYRSDDGGRNFTRRSTAVPPGLQTAQVHAVPGKAGHVFLAQGYDFYSRFTPCSLWRTTNAGDTWYEYPGWTRAWLVAFGKAKTGTTYPTIFVYGDRGGEIGVWRSTDEGATWDQIADYPAGLLDSPTSMCGDPDIFGQVYISYLGSSYVYGKQTGAPNEPPLVAVTAPLNNASYTAPASLTLTANASDPDGTVARVEFYQGPTLLGTDTTIPYSFAWSTSAVGSYAFTAKAFDNSGASTISAVANITVAPSTATTYYWDADASATGNHINGTNLGGTGTWNAGNVNWWNGSATADSIYLNSTTTPVDAVFTGTGGTVTCSLNAAVSTLSILSNGYNFVRGSSSKLGVGVLTNLTFDAPGTSTCTIDTLFELGNAVDHTFNVGDNDTLQLTYNAGALFLKSGKNIKQGNGALVIASTTLANVARDWQLDAGTLKIAKMGALNSTTAKTFTFNGGTLATTADVINNTTEANMSFVMNSGAINVATGTTFTHDKPTIGTGTLIKQGSGTLDGSASITGPVTINAGRLNPGLSNAAGTRSIGPLTIQTNGGLEIDLASDTSADVLTVKGSAIITGTLDVTTLGTYLPTLGRTWTILSATSISGGFVNITPGYSITKSGNTLVLTYIGAGMIYAEWCAAMDMYGALADPAACPSGDGIANLMKYALGLDPAAPATAADVLTAAKTPVYIALTFRRCIDTASIILEVQSSTDLVTWTTVTGATEIVLNNDIDSDGRTKLVEARVAVPSATKTFYRLRAR